VICATIERYFRTNPHPPRKIYTNRVKRFVENGGKVAAEALLFFYKTVVPSREHVEVIERYTTGLSNPEPARSYPAEVIISEQQEPAVVETSTAKPENERLRRPGGWADLSDLNEDSRFFSSEPKPEEHLARLGEEIKSRSYSSNTLRNYYAAVSRFLDTLTPESCNDWSSAFKRHLIRLKEDFGLAPSTINNHAASIKFFFVEVLEIQPGDDLMVRMKTGKPLPRVHSKENVAAILKTPRNVKHRLILMLVYGCGLRLGEVRFLRPVDIDVDREILWVRKGKGKKDRMIMLDGDLISKVKEWCALDCGKEYLFEGYRPGMPLARRTIEKVYENACSKLGIDRQGGIHSLRHSFATHLLEQGCDLRYIQELLGHASTKTTEIYTHVAAHKIVEIRSPIAGMI